MLCGIFDVTVGGSPPFRSPENVFFLGGSDASCETWLREQGSISSEVSCQAGRTKAANLRGAPMRGGWRL